jgi:hypothetical protein
LASVLIRFIRIRDIAVLLTEGITMGGSRREYHKRSSSNLNRRKLLKALGASGGALALSTMLPASWIKPMVRVGVLPAHAQTSSGFASYTENFPAGSSGSYETRSIPDGATALRVTVAGGSGAAGQNGAAGGDGGIVTATIGIGTVITAGTLIHIAAGAQGSGTSGGQIGAGPGDSTGGDGGGGTYPGGGGGGVSFVGTPIFHIVVAGGGGGGGGDTGGGAGGDGGANGGSTGITNGVNGDNANTAGGGQAGYDNGGTGTGGTFGAGGNTGIDGSAGSGVPALNGGDGGASNGVGGGGGGGGSGYGGGGGGGGDSLAGNGGGGGGGGAGYVEPGCTDISGTTGGNSGDGYVNITWL